MLETVDPSRLGKLKRKGAVGSLMLVNREGSAGSGSPLAFASSVRTAVSLTLRFSRTSSVPSFSSVSSMSSGRAPEKWLRVKTPFS